MKAPKPAIPKGAPAGTIWFGGAVDWFNITLRIRGDDLEPDEVSGTLRCQPDKAERKGEAGSRGDGRACRPARTGSWRLRLTPGETDEWDCAQAIMLLMQRLPIEIDAWIQLSQRFKIDIFVGLSMTSRNNGFSLPSDVMKYLGERGIEAGFDIYAVEDQQVEPAPAASGSG